MCYVFLARHVLHEPNAAGSLYGDALGFLDWAVLWTLWYILFLGSYATEARVDTNAPVLETAVESQDETPQA